MSIGVPFSVPRRSATSAEKRSRTRSGNTSVQHGQKVVLLLLLHALNAATVAPSAVQRRIRPCRGGTRGVQTTQKKGFNRTPEQLSRQKSRCPNSTLRPQPDRPVGLNFGLKPPSSNKRDLSSAPPRPACARRARECSGSRTGSCRAAPRRCPRRSRSNPLASPSASASPA